MGTIVHNPTLQTPGLKVINADANIIEKMATQIAAEVEKAIATAIQENIVIPVKTFIFDTWVITVEISKWGCIFGIVLGVCSYMLGDETKAKKLIGGSIIIQIIIQMLNYMFLG